MAKVSGETNLATSWPLTQRSLPVVLPNWRCPPRRGRPSVAVPRQSDHRHHPTTAHRRPARIATSARPNAHATTPTTAHVISEEPPELNGGGSRLSAVDESKGSVSISALRTSRRLSGYESGRYTQPSSGKRQSGLTPCALTCHRHNQSTAASGRPTSLRPRGPLLTLKHLRPFLCPGGRVRLSESAGPR